MKRFFRILWKINAILICAAGLMITVMLGYTLLSMAWSTGGNYGPSVAASPPGASGEKEETAHLTVTTVEDLAGTSIVRCTVQSGNEDSRKISSFSSDGGSGAICNYIFYDMTTHQWTTLFPTNNNVVVESDDFYFPGDPNDKRVVKWISYAVADQDTNHDGYISAADLQSLAVSHADGSGYHVYLTGIDRVLKTELIGENDFYAFYEQKKSIFVARIDLAGQKIIDTQKIF